MLTIFVCPVFLERSLHTFSYGDEIMEINDTVVYNMALNDVYSVLSQCTPGPVHIIISRHPNPKVCNSFTHMFMFSQTGDPPDDLEL